MRGWCSDGVCPFPCESRGPVLLHPGAARHWAPAFAGEQPVKPINPVPYIAMLVLVLGMIYLFYGR